MERISPNRYNIVQAVSRPIIREFYSEIGFMQCPSCKAENEAGAKQCRECSSRLPRKRRDSTVANEAAINPWIHSTNRTALNAYRCGLLAMIPFFGLVFGPLAIVLGLLGRNKERSEPSERGLGQATAAVVLGAATVVTQAAGLLLLMRGLS
jgi:hypothetical protein